jgi:hypothetical protein
LWRKVTTAFSRGSIITGGELSRLSLIEAGSLTDAAFGGESAGGDGKPELDVCHNTPSGLIAFMAVQPGGRVGGVTPSKFWENEAHPTGVGVAVAVGVGLGLDGGVGVEVGVGPSANPRISKTWSGHTWSGMQAFFRFQVMQPVP